MYRHLQAVCGTIRTDEVLKWASAHARYEQRQWLSNQGLGVRSTFCFRDLDLDLDGYDDNLPAFIFAAIHFLYHKFDLNVVEH